MLERKVVYSVQIPGAVFAHFLHTLINFNAATTTAFAGFLRLGEITYSKAQKDGCVFTTTKCTRNDITLAKDHMILRLKRSKTDVNHQEVSITITASGKPECACHRHLDI